MCLEGVHAIFIELLLHCCSAQPASILLLHSLASPMQPSPLHLLRHAGNIHRLLQLHSLAGQLIRVGRDALLNHASHIATAREGSKRSYSMAFSSSHSVTDEPHHTPACPSLQRLLHRVKWDASSDCELTSKRMSDPSETSDLDLLLIGSNMRFNPPNVCHMLTPELWSHVPDSCVMSCTQLVGRCDAVLPSRSLRLPLDYCRFARKLLSRLHTGWSFEHIMLSAAFNVCEKSVGNPPWPGVCTFVTQHLRSAEMIEFFIKHICMLFCSQTNALSPTPLVFASFLVILDAGLSSACSLEVLKQNLCSRPLPPFPCPSYVTHAGQLSPIAKRARAKLWTAFGACASDGQVLAQALAAACDKFNCTGLSCSLRDHKADAVGLVASAVIRASVEILGKSIKTDQSAMCSFHESSNSRWSSVLVALHSAGVISIGKLIQFLPDVQRQPVDGAIRGGVNIGDQNFQFFCSLSQCIIPTVSQADDKTVVQPQSFASNRDPRSNTRTLGLQSSSVPSLIPIKRDLKDYISWRVQFALLPPSCATLRQALSDLTNRYIRNLQSLTVSSHYMFS
jgi:hypothetical protein